VEFQCEGVLNESQGPIRKKSRLEAALRLLTDEMGIEGGVFATFSVVVARLWLSVCERKGRRRDVTRRFNTMSRALVSQQRTLSTQGVSVKFSLQAQYYQNILLWTSCTPYVEPTLQALLSLDKPFIASLQWTGS
jgi:hypothetical protein